MLINHSVRYEKESPLLMDPIILKILNIPLHQTNTSHSLVPRLNGIAEPSLNDLIAFAVLKTAIPFKEDDVQWINTILDQHLKPSVLTDTKKIEDEMFSLIIRDQPEHFKSLAIRRRWSGANAIINCFKKAQKKGAAEKNIIIALESLISEGLWKNVDEKSLNILAEGLANLNFLNAKNAVYAIREQKILQKEVISIKATPETNTVSKKAKSI